MNEAMAEYGIKVLLRPSPPRAQEAEMLSTMLAAGTAPDVLHTNQAALVSTYINNGRYLPTCPPIWTSMAQTSKSSTAKK
jgi:ABC-type glycerol-3-phosphate transport system substrate-binding protein